MTDVRGNQLRVLGKGNKERVLFLNDACVSRLIQDWLTERNMLALIDKEALFITHAEPPAHLAALRCTSW